MFKTLGQFFGKLFKGLLGGNRSGEADPYARAPVRSSRGPNGRGSSDRGSAVAVAEPGDE